MPGGLLSFFLLFLLSPLFIRPFLHLSLFSPHPSYENFVSKVSSKLDLKMIWLLRECTLRKVIKIVNVKRSWKISPISSKIDYHYWVEKYQYSVWEIRRGWKSNGNCGGGRYSTFSPVGCQNSLKAPRHFDMSLNSANINVTFCGTWLFGECCRRDASTCKMSGPPSLKSLVCEEVFDERSQPSEEGTIVFPSFLEPFLTVTRMNDFFIETLFPGLVFFKLSLHTIHNNCYKYPCLSYIGLAFSDIYFHDVSFRGPWVCCQNRYWS